MINFNLPIEVTEIFRIQKPVFHKKEDNSFRFDNDDDDEEEDEFNGIMAMDIEKIDITEYSSKTALLWEDIKMLKQYTYKDDWKQLKGEKYWIALHNYNQDLLVLGSYTAMLILWKEFRLHYPTFE